jgi:homoserine O-succinyltransferase
LEEINSMPLVGYSNLPTYSRLSAEGRQILSPDRALHQDIRELHIGFLNMMPDAALEATERQFFRLVGESNRIAQIYMHPFTLPMPGRGKDAQAHFARHYDSFEKLQEEGLDALIITGANITGERLEDEPFWKPLNEVLVWAQEHVPSTLCSCLATHAVMDMLHGQKRRGLAAKEWGVFSHKVKDRDHPLVRHMNTIFDVPHSRNNEITARQFAEAGMHVLVDSEEAGVHLATSQDGFRLICFQGHPEYDTFSLLKEYRREVGRFMAGDRPDYPPLPAHYMNDAAAAIALAYKDKAELGPTDLPFPEEEIAALLDNSWTDSARSVMGTWIGLVYQTTHMDRRKLFMDGVDPANPLGL